MRSQKRFTRRLADLCGLRSHWSQARERRVEKKRAFLVEPLEMRNLLAADLFDGIVFASAADSDSLVVESPQAAIGGGTLSTGAGSEQTAEGESAPDLVAFAKALTQAGTKYFTAAWCPNCSAQKALFEDGANYLNVIEVTNPDRTLNAVGIANNITSFPTWEFPDGTRLTGQQTLATISQRAGVAIPNSDVPSLKPIGNLTLLGGSPLHIPLDGYDPNGGPLTYTITSDNPALVAPTLIQGNRSMEIAVSGWGSMIFQLFEDRASRPTSRVIELAEDDFYNGIIFHRVIADFVIQGGDPTGTGTGGSGLGTFDDQFHVDLQHNRAGLLSYAKSTDDTNDSQFFVTLGPTRHLDFNHSIFGILVEGNQVLDAIGDTATTSADRPIYDIVMNSVDIFNDLENGVAMLKAAEGASGQANVTVTVTNALGKSVQETFLVTVKPDTTANGGANGAPFLQDIAPLTTSMNTPVNLQLAAVDVEGNPVYYDASAVSNAPYTINVNNNTGLVTVTPNAGFVGTTEVIVAVRAAEGSNTSDTWDRQAVSLTVTSGTPVLDLLEASDSNVATDNVTNLTNLQFRVSNVTTGATVRILRGETVLGQGTANGSTIDITTNNLAALGDGVYSLTAVQVVGGATSQASAPVTVTLDTTPPPAFTSTPPTTGVTGQFLTYDAQNPEEGTPGFTYALLGAPAGATVDPATGVLSWTPTTDQAGDNVFQIRGMDLAGNSVTQNLSIDVTAIDQDVRLRLATADLSGAPISTLSIGEEFLVQVFVQDIRQNPKGVFAAYLDVTYDPSRVSVVGENIVYGDPYENGKSGVLSVPGLIDEAGAFAGFTQTGSAEKFLLSVRMKADQAGQVQFVGNPADGVGHQILVYGSDLPIDWDAVTISPTTLLISSGVTAVNDLYNVDEDSTGTTLNLLANDINETGGTLTISQVGTTSHGGTVTIAANGQSVTYRPAANYFGEDTFTYTARSGDVTSVGTVTVQVQPVNDPPTAVNDTFTIGAGTSSNFLDVLANDSIAPDQGETLRVISVGTTSQGGTVALAPNGTHLLYTPKAGFGGTETFTYTISDRATTGGLTSTATVTITVESGPLPTANPDTATMAEDAAQTAINVLANDTPGEVGGVLRVTAVSVGSQGGTVTVGTNGANVLYKPKANFFGTETFTYTVQEQGGRSATGTVTVTVTSVNDPPTANNDTFDVSKDSPAKTLDVLANDTILPDVGETLTITAVTQGTQGGSVQIAADLRRLTYTPAAGFEGNETFTYTVSDGNGGTDQATVTIRVLEYTPRSVSGYVGANGTSLGGMTMNLVGSDEFANAVSRSTVSLADGTFAFDDLAPGSYTLHTIQAAAPKFLIDQPNTLAVQSDFSAGNSTGNNFELPGRQARFMTIADLLVTAPGQSSHSPANSLTVAIEPGQSQQWYSIGAGWTGYKNLNVQLSSNRSLISLTATNAQGQQFSGALNASDPMLVKWLGSDAAAYLIRIDAGPTHFNLQPVPNAAASGGEGEFSSFAAAASTTSATVPAAFSVVSAPSMPAGTATGSNTTPAGEATTPLLNVLSDEYVTQAASVPTSGAAVTIADTGWFAPLLENASEGEAEGESGTVANASVRPAIIDTLLTLEDFGWQTVNRDPLVANAAATDEEEYATAVDALMVDQSGILAEWE
jgi:cyclophilin family peptidyl-prolyl cis-trans isomerase